MKHPLKYQAFGLHGLASYAGHTVGKSDILKVVDGGYGVAPAGAYIIASGWVDLPNGLRAIAASQIVAIVEESAS